MRTCRMIIPVAITGFLEACGTGARPGSLPPAPVDTARPLPPPPAPMAPFRMIQVCVVQGGELTMVTAQYDPVSGDTITPANAWGRYPGPYVVDEPWFVNDEPVTVNGQRYARYGVPRTWQVGDLVRVGDYRGWPVFAERGGETDPSTVYVPLRSVCEFQPYVLFVNVGAVRG